MKRLAPDEIRRNKIRAKRSFLNKLKRKNKIWIGVYKKDAQSKYSSFLETFYFKNYTLIKPKLKQNALKINEEDNLFENPERVILFLLEIFNNAKIFQTVPTIIFKGRIRFSTLYLLDNICWEISRKRKWGFNFENMHKDDQYLFSSLRSFFSSNFENDSVYLLNEKVFINRDDGKMGNQIYKEKSKDITDMVIRGVRENSNPNFELSQIAYQAISSTIGEHFDNIIQHAPKSEFGYLCGFYDKQLKEVHILIFNFGKTIAESLSVAELPIEVLGEISQVIVNHKKKRFFNLFEGSFSEENALTLLALQEGISSKLEYDKSRGHGITDYIEHCFDLNNNTQITILSGKTAIVIDSKYRLENKTFLDRERRVIAFNENNDLFEKPDNNYVKNMSVFFPGLIIETRIPLNI